VSPIRLTTAIAWRQQFRSIELSRIRKMFVPNVVLTSGGCALSLKTLIESGEVRFGDSRRRETINIGFRLGRVLAAPLIWMLYRIRRSVTSKLSARPVESVRYRFVTPFDDQCRTLRTHCDPACVKEALSITTD